MATVDFKNQAVLKIVLSVLLGGGALGVFFFSHLVPFSYPNGRDRINTLKTEFEKKSTELARARASVADLPRFEAEYQQMHDRWSMAAELLPADRELAALLRRITLAGQQTGIAFVMFKPTSPRSQNYYTELPIEISVTGNYHQVGSFMAELANMRRIVTVANVKLMSNMKLESGHSTAAAMTASAYSLNPSTTAAAPPKTDEPKGGSSNAQPQS